MQVNPKHILQKYWGFPSFKGSQKAIIETLLSGHHVFALMPTGGGKSICFQVPAMAQDGICVVISPLVALIQNQIQVLKQKNIKAIGLTGGISYADLDSLLDNCIYGNYKFLYLSPERLQQPLVKERIQQMPVNLIAIDEAHCISEWGHDFRPTYRNCSVLSMLHPNVPVVALTATATQKVVEDIIDNLQIPEAIIYRDSFERKNIAFSIVNKQDKLHAVHRELTNLNKSAIVYVRTRRDTVLFAETLSKNRLNSTYFHGGLSNVEKKNRLNAWLNNTIQIMVATNAFGMGVDKADVETVAHCQLPDSIESYYQEAGRAGRNDKPAKAILFTNENDINQAKRQFVDALPDVTFVKKVYKKLNSFFQIAYGEGNNEVHFLKLNTFCSHYDLNPRKTYAALKLLDQNGILSTVETSRETNTIHITAHKEAIFEWIDSHDKMGSILQTLIRTYSGLFEFKTEINLSLIAKKSHWSESNINQTLMKLHADGLANYKSYQHDLKLIFLKPREDDKTINVIAPIIKKLNQTKQIKLQALVAYIKNVKMCRSEFLLHYFGEKDTKPCGKCDICYERLKQTTTDAKLKNSIMEVLLSGEKSSREIAQYMPSKESEVLRCIKELLEDQKLILKSNNTYELR